MGFFYTPMPGADTAARINACYENIKGKIVDRCGVADVMERDGWIAFSGSSEKPELRLTVREMKTKGSLYLYADVDDEVSWQEWDFENQEAFEDAVAAYIASLVNRTVKTVTETKRNKYMKTSRYYRNPDGEWILIDEEVVDSLLLCPFLTKDSVKEEVKSYRILP